MNKVILQRTKFVDYDTMTESYGFRILDEYAHTYSDSMSVVELDLPDDVFIRSAATSLDGDDVGEALIQFAQDSGLYLDDEWYTAEQVRNAINPPKRRKSK